MLKAEEYQDHIIYHYGSYEAAFLKRMRREATAKRANRQSAWPIRERPRLDLWDCLLPDLFQWPERHRLDARIQLDGEERFRTPKSGMETPLGAW